MSKESQLIKELEARLEAITKEIDKATNSYQRATCIK